MVPELVILTGDRTEPDDDFIGGDFIQDAVNFAKGFGLQTPKGTVSMTDAGTLQYQQPVSSSPVSAPSGGMVSGMLKNPIIIGGAALVVLLLLMKKK